MHKLPKKDAAAIHPKLRDTALLVYHELRRRLSDEWTTHESRKFQYFLGFTGHGEESYIRNWALRAFGRMVMQTVYIHVRSKHDGGEILTLPWEGETMVIHLGGPREHSWTGWVDSDETEDQKELETVKMRDGYVYFENVKIERNEPYLVRCEEFHYHSPCIIGFFQTKSVPRPYSGGSQ